MKNLLIAAKEDIGSILIGGAGLLALLYIIFGCSVSHGAQFNPKDRGTVTHGHKGQSRKGRTPWSTEKLSNGAPLQIISKGAL